MVGGVEYLDQVKRKKENGQNCTKINLKTLTVGSLTKRERI
jgi:hypothetical protein